MSRQNSHLFSFKKEPLCNEGSLYYGQRTFNLDAREINSYKLKILLPTKRWSGEFRILNQVNLHGVNPVFSGWWAMQGDIKPRQSLYTKQRFAKGVQTIFSITFCTLVTVYCTCKIAKDAFRIVLYFTTFYVWHCAVARFVLKQYFVCSWDVQCFMLLKVIVFELWKNNFKCSLKTSVSPVLATKHLKL